MADKYQIDINASLFQIRDLVNNKVVFNSTLNYLFFDPTGDIIFPSSATLSATNYNLTYRFDDLERVIGNPITGNVTPTSFDVYHTYFRSLNETIINSTFTTVQASNVELPSITAGEPIQNYSDGGDGGSVGDGNGGTY